MMRERIGHSVSLVETINDSRSENTRKRLIRVDAGHHNGKLTKMQTIFSTNPVEEV